MIKKLNSYFQFTNNRIAFKLRASTIVETLIASLIIIIIFTIASLTLNNVFKATIKKDTTLIHYRLNKLNYLIQNNNLPIPYFEEYEEWNISIKNSKGNTGHHLYILAEKDSIKINKSFVNVGF